MSALRDLSYQSRRFVPLPLLLALGRRRAAKLWATDAFRESAELNMRYLLENTERADEVPQLAEEYLEYEVLRNYRRWHAKPILTQPVEGIEWLTTKRDPDRGVVVNFMHHGQYGGMIGSIAHAGALVRAVVAPEAFDPKTEIQLRQHYKLCGAVPEAPLVSTAEGTAGMTKILENRENLLIASDVAGRTPVQFLGKEIGFSFGAALLAVRTNSPVVLLTFHPDAAGDSTIRLHEPIEPGDFAGPEELLAEIFRLHEPAVLAWPTAYDSPYGRLELARQASG